MTTTAVRPPRVGRVAGLYAITPDVGDTGLLVALVDAALAGGARVVQYRNKGAGATAALAQAKTLAGACRAHGRPLIVNDRVDVALAIDDAGLHVGADDADDLAALRAALGPDRILGVSCYRSVERAREAVEAGADYVAFGSLFPSTTKPHAPPAPLALFAKAAALGVPLVGIGGIDASNIAALIAAGADAAAVIGDLFGSGDPATVRARAVTLARAFEPSADRRANP